MLSPTLNNLKLSYQRTYLRIKKVKLLQGLPTDELDKIYKESTKNLDKKIDFVNLGITHL